MFWQGRVKALLSAGRHHGHEPVSHLAMARLTRETFDEGIL